MQLLPRCFLTEQDDAMAAMADGADDEDVLRRIALAPPPSVEARRELQQWMEKNHHGRPWKAATHRPARRRFFALRAQLEYFRRESDAQHCGCCDLQEQYACLATRPTRPRHRARLSSMIERVAVRCEQASDDRAAVGRRPCAGWLRPPARRFRTGRCRRRCVTPRRAARARHR